MLQIVSESCPTKIFLANPEMDRDLYREAFHLNDTELELIAGLVPPGQMLIRKAQSSKKVQLNVDSVSHWMATNNARDNLIKRDYFARFGIAEGLRRLAQDYPFRPRTAGRLRQPQPRHKEPSMQSSLPHLHSCWRSLMSVPRALPRTPSARTVQYHSQDIVPIHAKLKYTTLIEVPPTEKIMEAATGDKEFWVVDVVGNFCFVHPAKAGISSNLNLITDKGNIYSFTLQDVSGTSQQPDLKVLVEPADHSSIVASPDRRSSFLPRSWSSRSSSLRAAGACHPGRGRVQERVSAR